MSAKELAEAIDLYKHAHSKATRRGKRDLRTDKAKGLHGASTGAAAMMSMPGAHALPKPEGSTPNSRDKMRSLSKRAPDGALDTDALGVPHNLPPGMPVPHNLPPGMPVPRDLPLQPRASRHSRRRRPSRSLAPRTPCPRPSRVRATSSRQPSTR